MEITANLDPAPSKRAKSRKNRVFVFHEFLVSTYGIGYLRRGTVLDVAGGKGDLSWLLENLSRVQSVVLDPRTTSDGHWIRSVEYLRLRPDEAARRSVQDQSTHQPLAAVLDRLPTELRTPRHLRVLANQALVGALSRYKASGNVGEWEAFFCEATSIGKTSQPLLGRAPMKASRVSVDGEACRIAAAEVPGGTGSSVRDAREALALFLNVTLVVGFHPDQAVDSCLDLAELLDVPFCVVPCCVFPREFPHRRLVRADGRVENVRAYAQLIEYLSRKAPSCETASLNFYSEPASCSLSRNTVLFTRPAGNTISPSQSSLFQDPSTRHDF
jgi:hypothetical protein